MAAVAVLTTASDYVKVEKSTSGNSLTVPLPANAKVGDVLIATYASDNNSPVATATPGWVKISAARAGTTREAAVFHAFTADGLPAPPVFTQGASTVSPRATAAMYRVTGASQTERVSGTSAWAATADTTNLSGMVIPSTGGSGLTIAVAYNNATAAQGATLASAVTFNGNTATSHLTSYGTGNPASASSTNSAIYFSSTPGPFTLAWGKSISNSQGVAVTIPAAGGGGDVPTEPETPQEPEHDDEKGVAIQIGTNNVTTAAENSDGTNSITVPIPSRVRNGDVLICAVVHSENAALSFPSGWTLLSTPRTGTNRWLAVYGFPVTNSNPAAPVFTAAGSVTDLRMSAVMFRLTGVGAADYLASTSEWQVTDAGANRTEFTIPAAPSAGTRSLIVVYNNTTAGASQSRATVAGATLVGSAGKTVVGRATTTLDVLRATGGGAKTVTLSPAAANAAGFQLTFQPKQVAPPATWEARVFQNGQLRNATVAAVRSGSQFLRPGVVSWRPKDYTLNDLFSTDPFFIAHRGSGDNWPEHTMTSYTNATAYGVKALELSVSATKDGILICHHDLNFLKTAGDPRKVADMTYAEIQQEIKIDSRAWTGLATPLVSPPLAKDVIDAYIDTHVIFIEDKGGTAATTLLNLMDSYPRGKEKFVWKQWAGAGQWQAAKDRGYKLWGYFMADIFARIPELAPNFDFLGIPHTASDQVISEIVAIGKDLGIPVICWEIHYRWMADRVRALGVKGLMTSNIPYVMTAQGTAQATRDSFATGLRGPGDLPHTTDGSWSVQPQVDPADGGVLRYIANASGAYVMGSMCPLPWERYAIEFEMRWPTRLPGASLHAGIWFGHGTDITHRTGSVSTEGGYHLIQRVNGTFDLYRHDPGSSAGIPLATASATPPVIGQWMKFRVEVAPERIAASRAGQNEISSLDTLYRGKYFGLQKNFAMTTGDPETPLEYRNIIVSPLP